LNLSRKRPPVHRGPNRGAGASPRARDFRHATRALHPIARETHRSTPGEKAFTFCGVNAAFDVDVFNVLNSGTVLGRQYDVQASNSTRSRRS
jgi:hypothetical protein